MAQKIKKGDEVVIITGKDKGNTGKVLEVLTDKVVVEGINVVTKNQKSRRTRSQGQQIQKPMPVHISNVALLEGGKAVRVGFMIEGEGKDKKKVRVARPSGKKI